MTGFPDEELPRRLDAAEAELARSEHRWFARITLLTALATGLTFLLPWTYTRRYGLSVWQLGIETHPVPAITWLAGIVTTVAALAFRPGARTQVTAGVTAVIATSCLALAWQATSLDPAENTWPGPGPSFAIATSALWLLAAVAELVAQNNNPAAPDEAAVTRAIGRLRRTR